MKLLMVLSTRFKISLARCCAAPIRWGRRLLGAQGDRVEVLRRGLRWRLDLKEGIDFSIYLLGAFEPQTIRVYEKLIRPGDTVLDIGANIGAHTLPLARAVGDTGAVHAFEPTAWAFRKLLDNLDLNQELQGRVRAHQIMLAPRDDMELAKAIYSSWPLSADSGRHAGHLGLLKSTEGARAVSLDSYLQAAEVDRVDFVKLDVDGHECDVFDGWTTLDRYRPVILMEMAPYLFSECGCSLARILQALTRAGYRLESLGSGEAIPLDAGLLERHIGYGRGINVTAWPKEGRRPAAVR